MKLLASLALSVVLLSACNNAQENNTATETPAQEAAATTAPVATGPIDPVCEMAKDSTWTEYSVGSNNDTTWFCSDVCKGVYDKNPAKYKKG